MLNTDEAVPSILPSRRDANRADEWFEELRTTAHDPARHDALDASLRIATRLLMPNLCSPRKEKIEPIADVLRFVAANLNHTSHIDADGINRRYLVGRVDALLDLCAIALDQSISTAAVDRVAGNPNARVVLATLFRHGETARADLLGRINAESNTAKPLTDTGLSNLLEWMEECHLVRRRRVGNFVSVHLGPKGEAVLGALPSRPEPAPIPEEIPAQGVEDVVVGPLGPAVAAAESAPTVEHSPVPLEFPNQPLDTLNLSGSLLMDLRAFIEQRGIAARDRASFDQPSSTILIYGETGCGKSSLVRAIATELRAPLARIDAAIASNGHATDVLSLQWLRPGPHDHNTAVLWLDQLDVLFPTPDRCVDRLRTERLLASYLHAVEDHRRKGLDLVVIGESAEPWNVHNDARERFDVSYHLPFPDKTQTSEIVETLFSSMNVGFEPRQSDLPELLSGMGPRHILATCRLAAGLAAGRGSNESGARLLVDRDDIKAALVRSQFVVSLPKHREREKRYLAFEGGKFDDIYRVIGGAGSRSISRRVGLGDRTRAPLLDRMPPRKTSPTSRPRARSLT